MGRGLTCIAITLIILGGLAILIAWLADKSKSPTFTIDQGAIDNFNFTTNNSLNATFTLVIRSHNRDSKYKIKYRVVAVSVYHTEDYALGYETLGPFVQGSGDDIVFSSKPVARNVLVSDAETAGAIRNETKARVLNVEVRVRASVRYEVKNWKHVHYTLKVICTPVVINLVTGKTNQVTNCDVGRF